MTPNLRPTRRGYAVLTVGTGALVAGAVFGPRALDAVVLPAAVALLAAVVQVWRTPTPEVDRRLPPADVPGTTGVVELTLDASETYPATVRERLPPEISSDACPSEFDPENASIGDRAAVIEATVGGEAVSYEVTPQRRGKHEIGPASVVATDVLGLVERTHEVETRDAVVAFPRVRSLSSAVRADLRAMSRSRSQTGRNEFDGLREYVRGDALRDVHWKTSARRDELVVRKFTAEADPERVTVVARTESDGRSDDAADPSVGPEGHTTAGGAEESAAESGGKTDPGATGTGDTADHLAADAMAESAASVCLALVRDGSSVALTTPSGSVEATPGQVRELLDHLAVAEGGRVSAESADIEIIAGIESTTVRFDGREHDFETLVNGTAAVDERTTGSAAVPGATSGSENRERADGRGAREVGR